MEKKLFRMGVNVRLMKKANSEEIIRGNYDKVIIATGSTSLMPPIEGIELSVQSTDVLTGNVKVGKKAVVIGGGLVGCETAAFVKETSNEVTIIEMLDDILLTANHSKNNDQALREMLAEREIKIVAPAKVKRITSEGVFYEKEGKDEIVYCDTVIIAAGYKSNNSLADELEDKVKSLTIIGDASSPRKILTAVHEAYHAIRVM